MNWREGFLRQARSDAHVMRLLNQHRAAYSHQLHYLQMVTEKLAKGLLSPLGTGPAPTPSHSAFVRCLQVIKGRPELQEALGYNDSSIFRKFIDSILPLAADVERLAPAMAGTTQPNPEYPWQSSPHNPVVAPCEYDFSLFNPRKQQMIKLQRLIDGLLRVLR